MVQGRTNIRQLVSQLSLSEIMVQERTNIRQLVSQLSLSEIMVHWEPIPVNSYLNCRWVRAWFRENQHRSTRISTIAEWEHGSGRINTGQLVPQLSLSESMVQGEPTLVNSYLNYHWVRAWFCKNQHWSTRTSTIAEWEHGSGRINTSQLVSQLSLSESMVQGEPTPVNSYLNNRWVRAWFWKNQHWSTRTSTIAEWEHGSGRTNTGQLVPQLSLSESMVQREPTLVNSYLNYRWVRSWFRENQHRSTRTSTIAEWEHGSGRTNTGQLVPQLSLSESMVLEEPTLVNSYLNYHWVRAWFWENQHWSTRTSTIAEWEHGFGRTNTGQLVPQLSLSESMVQGEPTPVNSYLNYRWVRAWFRENQHRSTRTSTIAEWEHGSGRINTGQLVPQLSLSESMVQGESTQVNSYLNYRWVRAWFRENQHQSTRTSTITEWEHGSGRINTGQLVPQLSLSESMVQGESTPVNSYLNYRWVRAWFWKNQHWSTHTSTITEWEHGSGRINTGQLVPQLSLSESMVQGESTPVNSYLNYRWVRAWFWKNQHWSTRTSTIAEWEHGSGRTNTGQLVPQLSPSESMVLEEPTLVNSYLNYRWVRAWFRENQHRSTRTSTIAEWEHGSGRTNTGQLVPQLSLSESMVLEEPTPVNSYLNYHWVRAWFWEKHGVFSTLRLVRTLYHQKYIVPGKYFQWVSCAHSVRIPILWFSSWGRWWSVGLHVVSCPAQTSTPQSLAVVDLSANPLDQETQCLIVFVRVNILPTFS